MIAIISETRVNISDVTLDGCIRHVRRRARRQDGDCRHDGAVISQPRSVAACLEVAGNGGDLDSVRTGEPSVRIRRSLSSLPTQNLMRESLQEHRDVA